ncbi:MSHA pilin protein MshA (plasmid) [Rhodovulum sp. P5]|uniref:Calx-beta domain-containing protein n=1 Tax=Rhodovulum sp. P5 TaxID=1564506 RepID=UPI0009C24FB5|nr:Calx-beta domain-containing protein [Rhodovulum sp. P5]ARE42337.1 MSHA pilin protein MshA [Rhodovulum sp. P5]
MVNVIIASAVAVEGGYLNFTVTLSEAAPDAITMSYRTLMDTADDGDLYYAATSSYNNGTITFAPGETSVEITIRTDGDYADERDENIVLELYNLSENAAFAGGEQQLRAMGVILDDDGTGPNLALFVSDPIIEEGDSGTKGAVFELRLSRPAESVFTVTYATRDISAVAGEDYGARAGSVTFSAGQDVATVRVPVYGDTVFEGTESFALVVDAPANPSIGIEGLAGEATIRDDDADPWPSVSISSARATEGSYLRFVVTLSEPSLDAVTLSYRTLMDTADDGDLYYAATSSYNNGTITFAPGETSVEVTIRTDGEYDDERDENIVLELYNLSENAEFAGGEQQLRATGVILDNDGTGSNLALFVSNPVLEEGDSGTKEAVFELRLSQPATTAFTVTYATRDISAQAGVDYLAQSGSVSFAAGQDVATVRVQVYGDTTVEGTESFALVVDAPASPLVSTEGLAGEATIRDDDAGLWPSVSIASATATEGSYLRFTVTLSEPSLDAITMSYRTLRDTAGDDDLSYATTSNYNNGTITFSPGETSADILIRSDGEYDDERDENIVVELYNLSENAEFADGEQQLRATGVIRDNDGTGPNLALFVSDPVLAEGDSGTREALFELRLSQPATAAFTVTYATRDISAQAGVDYAAQSGSISFAVGQDVATVRVPVYGDYTAEATESFALVVDTPDSPFIDTEGLVGEATILDDDANIGPSVSISSAQASETYEYLRFTVTLSEPSVDAVAMSYRTLQDTADDSDMYYATTSDTYNNGTIAFAPGETSTDIFIRTDSDSVDERDENVVLELYNLSANATFAGGELQLRATGVILDDDGTGPNLALFVSDPILVEGDGGTKEAVFELRLSQPAGTDFTVTYATQDITAIAGQDYAARSGTVSFATGQDVATVRVPVYGDTMPEMNESFALVVEAPTSPSITFEGLAGEATIRDDDSSQWPGVSISSATALEWGYSGYLRFVVSLSEASDVPVQISYQTDLGDALQSDLYYSDNTGVLDFAPGETSKSVFIRTDSDSLDERDESVFLRLTSYQVGESYVTFPDDQNAMTAVGFILDDDGVGPNRMLAALPTSVREGDSCDPVHFVPVYLSSPAADTLVFDVSAQNGTATAGVDFELLTDTVTFLPGQTSAAVQVAIFGDRAEEGTESFTLSFAPATDTPFVGTIQNRGVTILDMVDVPDGSYYGTNGSESVTLTSGNDTYYAYGGNDTVSGGSGHDVLHGCDGNDRLLGGSGDDILYGEGGMDTLTGGDGSDVFHLSSNFPTGTSYHDTITDFTGEDVIRFHDGLALISASSGAAETQLHFDTDSDGAADAILTLRGDFRDYEFHTRAYDDDEVEAYLNVQTGSGGASTRGDFNGDGTSDILWRKSAGHVGYFEMENGGHTYHAIGWAGTDWSVEGTGDLNGDGTSDILWRKSAGHVGYFQMENGTHSYHAIGWAGTDWTVQGLGDLNGDGTDDILWRKSAGHVGYFEMDNGSHTYQAIGWAGTDWTVVGIGDLNGDGTDDILWRKSAGHVGYFEMDNGSHTYHAIGWAGTDWSVEGVGDLNGDGTDDILWRKDTGHVGYFEMHDGQDTYHAIGWAGTDWSVEGVGDVNGDGTDDVIWRKDTGRVSYWEMNDGDATYHAIADVGTDWQIV